MEAPGGGSEYCPSLSESDSEEEEAAWFSARLCRILSDILGFELMGDEDKFLADKPTIHNSE